MSSLQLFEGVDRAVLHLIMEFLDTPSIGALAQSCKLFHLVTREFLGGAFDHIPATSTGFSNIAKARPLLHAHRINIGCPRLKRSEARILCQRLLQAPFNLHYLREVYLDLTPITAPAALDIFKHKLKGRVGVFKKVSKVTLILGELYGTHLKRHERIDYHKRILSVFPQCTDLSLPHMAVCAELMHFCKDFMPDLVHLALGKYVSACALPEIAKFGESLKSLELGGGGNPCEKPCFFWWRERFEWRQWVAPDKLPGLLEQLPKLEKLCLRDTSTRGGTSFSMLFPANLPPALRLIKFKDCYHWKNMLELLTRVGPNVVVDTGINTLDPRDFDALPQLLQQQIIYRVPWPRLT